MDALSFCMGVLLCGLVVQLSDMVHDRLEARARIRAARRGRVSRLA